MGGIIADNVGRSSGLIKGAAAPAGTVLVDIGYCSSAPGSGGYVTWAAMGVGQMASSTGEWGGVLAGSTEAISWGSTITFPSTGVYQIWCSTYWDAAQSSGARPQLEFEDGNAYKHTFIDEHYLQYSWGKRCISTCFGYTVSNTSDDTMKTYKLGSGTMNTGRSSGANMIISKFE